MSQRGRHKQTEETRTKLRKIRLGKKQTEGAKSKLSEFRKGKKHSETTKQKMSKAQLGEKSHLWKGGITPVIKLIRQSSKYREWRQQVFIRDNFTCQKCGDNKGGNLEAHHRKSLSKLLAEARKYMPLLTPYDSAMIYSPFWDVDNGKTLCQKCHKKTNNYLKYRRINQ